MHRPVSTMPEEGPTLPDMLATVPCLLATCMYPSSGERDRHQRVRDLRLVGKGFSAAVMQTISKCSLQLGEGSNLKPGQVVRMLRSCRLQEMTVDVVTTSGGADTFVSLRRLTEGIHSQFATSLQIVMSRMTSTMLLQLSQKETMLVAVSEMSIASQP